LGPVGENVNVGECLPWQLIYSKKWVEIRLFLFGKSVNSWQMSALANVRLGKCLPWQMSSLGNVDIGKCPPWQMSALANVCLGKCLPWQMSVMANVCLGKSLH
jgi:hypothetical protein